MSLFHSKFLSGFPELSRSGSAITSPVSPPSHTAQPTTKSLLNFIESFPSESSLPPWLCFLAVSMATPLTLFTSCSDSPSLESYSTQSHSHVLASMLLCFLPTWTTLQILLSIFLLILAFYAIIQTPRAQDLRIVTCIFYMLNKP